MSRGRSERLDGSEPSPERGLVAAQGPVDQRSLESAAGAGELRARGVLRSKGCQKLFGPNQFVFASSDQFADRSGSFAHPIVAQSLGIGIYEFASDSGALWAFGVHRCHCTPVRFFLAFAAIGFDLRVGRHGGAAGVGLSGLV